MEVTDGGNFFRFRVFGPYPVPVSRNNPLHWMAVLVIHGGFPILSETIEPEAGNLVGAAS